MKISLIGVGKIKRGPERAMVDDYMSRAKKLAKPLGFRDIQEIEVDVGPDKAGEGQKLLAKVPDGAKLVLFDETGESTTSRSLARKVGKLRDDGCPELCFVIGGADGFTDEIKAQAADKICLGKLTWPHKLVRVMASEQIYRSLSLLAGTPYHRD